MKQYNANNIVMDVYDDCYVSIKFGNVGLTFNPKANEYLRFQGTKYALYCTNQNAKVSKNISRNDSLVAIKILGELDNCDVSELLNVFKNITYNWR